MSKNSEYAVETISLTKAFKDWWGRTRVLAVEDLDLKIEHNEVYGLLGPNGSGKSTTIKMLLSLLKPTKGVSFVLGGRSDDPKIAAKIGFLPEESYLYKYLSARETLRFYGNLFGLPSKVLDMRIESLLDMVGLSGMTNRPIGTFSKGMQRRVGLAQALINDPDLLILDEPTSGLDPIGTRQIKDLIKSLSKRGKTILMCSHLLSDVEDVCDRIGILYGGRMQTEGRVKDLLQISEKNQITTDQLSEQAIAKIRSIVEKEKSGISISRPMNKLEDLFVQIVDQAQSKIATSGAVSTTQIGDFLKEEAKQEGILEQLVTAEVKKEQELKPVEKAPVSEPEAETETTDSALLKDLAAAEIETETSEAPTTEQVEKPQADVESAEEINKNLLDDLLKGPKAPEKKAKEIEDE